MADYTATHAGALASVQNAGTAVTFTFTNPGTYDVSTGAYSGGTTTTVTGSAIATKGDPVKYQQLGLVQSEAPTLLFCPDTFGSVPALGSSVSWNGTTYIVRDVERVGPDGNVILARVVVAR